MTHKFNTKTFLTQLNQINPSSIWRLLIDYNRQNIEGPTGFDKDEENYLSGLFSALEFLLKNIGKPIDVNFIHELHSRAVKKVSTIYVVGILGKPTKYKEKFQEEFRNSVTSFGVNTKNQIKNITIEGLTEQLNKMKMKESKNSFNIYGETILGEEEISSKTLQKVENIPKLAQNLMKVMESSQVQCVAPQLTREEVQKHIQNEIKKYKGLLKNEKKQHRKN